LTSPDPAYARDPQYVQSQYASETNLAARSSLYAEVTGPHPGDIALVALAEVHPRSALEVGCGTGWFAQRVRDELGADVVALDQSERMVELAHQRGLDARLGDVQELPFEDAQFDVVAANWMLYHVPDLDCGLGEIARVLRPGGRLVAVTNGVDHLLEFWELVDGVEEPRMSRDLAFSAESGETSLRRHFERVEMRDASGTVLIDDREAVVRYIASNDRVAHLLAGVPASFEPFHARRSNVVFVADK
jgi:SAM-dependent methyltransferase